MKKNFQINAPGFSGIAGLVLILLAFSSAVPTMAQPGRDRQGNGRDEGSRREWNRPPSVRQQPSVNNGRNLENRNNQRMMADNFNRRNIDRSPSISNSREYSLRRNADQNIARRDANDFNRGNRNYNRGNDNYNRNNGNSNRVYSRPGISYNNRPGFTPGRNNRSYGYNGYNNYRRPAYSAYNPNWRYAYAPRRFSVFNTLPSFYLNLNFGGSHYQYYDGIYYRPYNNVFRVVPPPIGIFINTLPVGYRRIYVNDYPYYYYNGTYYDQRDNYYTVVSPPVGAVVESIPDGYKTITIDGETYYEVDGAQYKPVVQENGEIWYEVIKSN